MCSSVRAQHELAGMEDEGDILSRFDHLGKIGHILPNVDIRSARVAEYQNLRAEMDVYACRLNTAFSQGVDDNATLVDLFTDRAVAQYHAYDSCP